VIAELAQSRPAPHGALEGGQHAERLRMVGRPSLLIGPGTSTPSA